MSKVLYEADIVFELSLDAVCDVSFPVSTQKCVHCNYPMRLPIVQKETDRRKFAVVWEALNELCSRHNLTEQLIAIIHARCAIARAQLPEES